VIQADIQSSILGQAQPDLSVLKDQHSKMYYNNIH
jgi:hypothetical protein